MIPVERRGINERCCALAAARMVSADGRDSRDGGSAPGYWILSLNGRAVAVPMVLFADGTLLSTVLTGAGTMISADWGVYVRIGVMIDGRRSPGTARMTFLDDLEVF